LWKEFRFLRHDLLFLADSGGFGCYKFAYTQLRELIFRMVAEKPTWGAPRIHGELQLLGFDILERTVLRWMRRTPKRPESAKR
jgi:hypothetical protein